MLLNLKTTSSENIIKSAMDIYLSLDEPDKKVLEEIIYNPEHSKTYKSPIYIAPEFPLANLSKNNKNVILDDNHNFRANLFIGKRYFHTK